MFAHLKIETTVYAIGATLAVVVGFLLSGLAQGLEHWSTDLQIAYLSDRRLTQHPRIALIVVNDQTLKGYFYTSPVDRTLIAELVDRLDQAGAKIIGLDFIFDRPTEPNKDDILVTAIQRAKAKMILAGVDDRTPLAESGRAFQSQFFARTGRPVGHSYFDENHSPLVLSDRVVRFIAEPKGSPALRSFAEVLAASDGHDVQSSSPYISWLLAPKNRAETFLTLSAENVLARDNAAAALPLGDLVRGRIVLIGGDFPDRDQHLTPLSLASSERYSGIFVHAQILAQLLDHRSIRPLGWPIETLILIIAACGSIWFGRRDRFGHRHFWIRSIGLAGLIIVGAVAFAFFRVIFPITLTMLILLAGTTFGYHSKRFVG